MMEIPSSLLEEHRLAAIALKELKTKELILRNQINDVLLDGLPAGTHNFLIDGYKIKSVKGLNYSFDTESLLQLIEDGELSEQELDLLRVKYELKLTPYKEAMFDTTILDDVIIVKPALPSLSIILGD